MVIQGTNDYIDNGNGVIEFSLVFYVAPVIFIDDRGCFAVIGNGI